MCVCARVCVCTLVSLCVLSYINKNNSFITNLLLITYSFLQLNVWNVRIKLGMLVTFPKVTDKMQT